MSIQDFDNLTAALADRAISRRRALQMAAASALGAAGLNLAAGEAQATHNECPRRGAGCCRNCVHTGSRVCICVRNINGDRRCVHQCCPTESYINECEDSGDCPAGQICIRRNSCAQCADVAPTQPGVCMVRCGEPTPTAAQCDPFRC